MSLHTQVSLIRATSSESSGVKTHQRCVYNMSESEYMYQAW